MGLRTRDRGAELALLLALNDSVLCRTPWARVTSEDRRFMKVLQAMVSELLEHDPPLVITPKRIAREFHASERAVERRVENLAGVFGVVKLGGLVGHCRSMVAMVRCGYSEEQILGLIEQSQNLPRISVRHGKDRR